MKIRAIIPNEKDNASIWWRIVRPLILMREFGHDTRWIEYNDLDLPNLDVKDALVILHRLIVEDAKTYVKLLYDNGARCVIYSTDDFTLEKESLTQYLSESGGLTRGQLTEIIDRIPKQLELINECEEILVSSPGLERLVSEQTTRSVKCLPNAIDVKWFVDRLELNPPFQYRDDFVYIGWGGGRRPESDLEPMAIAWGLLAQNPYFDHVKFVVSGWQPDIIDRNIPLERKIRRPWLSLEEWPKNMQVDIGCCPLNDNVFNQGKSVIKFLEFTLAGAVVVASPTNYEDAIVNFASGWIAQNNTVEAWYERLCQLATKEAKIVRLSTQSMAEYDVTKYHSLEYSLWNWIKYFERLIEFGVKHESTSVS